MAERKRYLSYLLRLWRVNDQDLTCWHTLLESIQDTWCQNFFNLDDLVVILRKETSNWPINPTIYHTPSQLKE